VSKGKRSLTEEEQTLWGRVAATVKPRRGPKQPAANASPAPPVSPRKPSHAPLQQPKSNAAKRTLAPPQDRGAEKRVRRGKLEIGGKLDLHGHTLATGRTALVRFLHAAYDRGDRTVIVITGVGRAGHGVLKQNLPDWLASAEVRAFVAGFAQAHRAHGGAGAFYVFLKR
jgi:DNA-nicking Smr family endonuclease